MTAVIGFTKNLKEHPDLSGYGFNYAWLEGAQGARLCRLDDVQNWRDLMLWPAGRLFGDPGEYRWQTIPGGGLHIVLLLEQDSLPSDFQPGRLQLEPLGDTNLILWGEWVDPAKNRPVNLNGGPRFYAREIPQIQDYPLSPKDMKLIQDDAANQPRKVSPCLVVRRYRHQPPDKNSPSQGEFLRAVCLGVQQKGPQDEETN